MKKGSVRKIPSSLMEFKDILLEYLLVLTTTVVLPTAIWLIASSQIFSRLRTFSQENYQEKVRETLENVVIDKISDKLIQLFPEHGVTPPTKSVHFPTVVRKLMEDADPTDKLTFLSESYQSLMEANTGSQFFLDAFHLALSILSGGA